MNVLQARDIPDAWYQAVRHVLENGEDYIVERGSFEGHSRRQVPFFAMVVNHPEARPLGVTYRDNVISTDDAIFNYYLQLISPEIAPNETYTYGERIALRLPEVAEMLCKTPNTNQATIEVGKPEDILLDDPPCLRLVSWKKVRDTLQLTVFFRSWDVVNGLPFNLGGLQYLNETIATLANIKPGKLVAYSDGLHAYDMSFGILGDQFKECHLAGGQ